MKFAPTNYNPIYKYNMYNKVVSFIKSIRNLQFHIVFKSKSRLIQMDLTFITISMVALIPFLLMII
jgi:hypothetical protein